MVASRAEAWIETRESPLGRIRWKVASRAEAWIETFFLSKARSPGLVASRAEAWIETFRLDHDLIVRASPPARRRGLKRSRNHRELERKRRLPRGGVD